MRKSTKRAATRRTTNRINKSLSPVAAFVRFAPGVTRRAASNTTHARAHRSANRTSYRATDDSPRGRTSTRSHSRFRWSARTGSAASPQKKQGAAHEKREHRFHALLKRLPRTSQPRLISSHSKSIDYKSNEPLEPRVGFPAKRMVRRPKARASIWRGPRAAA